MIIYDPKSNAVCTPAGICISQGPACLRSEAAVHKPAFVPHTRSALLVCLYIARLQTFTVSFCCCRMQWDHRSVEIALYRNTWPIQVAVSGHNVTAALAAQDAARDAAYGRYVKSAKEQGVCASASGR